MKVFINNNQLKRTQQGTTDKVDGCSTNDRWGRVMYPGIGIFMGGSGMQTENQKKMIKWNFEKSWLPLIVPLIYNLKMYS